MSTQLWYRGVTIDYLRFGEPLDGDRVPTRRDRRRRDAPERSREQVYESRRYRRRLGLQPAQGHHHKPAAAAAADSSDSSSDPSSNSSTDSAQASSTIEAYKLHVSQQMDQVASIMQDALGAV